MWALSQDISSCPAPFELAKHWSTQTHPQPLSLLFSSEVFSIMVSFMSMRLEPLALMRQLELPPAISFLSLIIRVRFPFCSSILGLSLRPLSRSYCQYNLL